MNREDVRNGLIYIAFMGGFAGVFLLTDHIDTFEVPLFIRNLSVVGAFSIWVIFEIFISLFLIWLIPNDKKKDVDESKVEK